MLQEQTEKPFTWGNLDQPRAPDNTQEVKADKEEVTLDVEVEDWFAKRPLMIEKLHRRREELLHALEVTEARLESLGEHKPDEDDGPQVPEPPKRIKRISKAEAKAQVPKTPKGKKAKPPERDFARMMSPTATQQMQKVVDFVKTVPEPILTAQITDRLGMAKASVYRALELAEQAGKVRKISAGKKGIPVRWAAT